MPGRQWFRICGEFIGFTLLFGVLHGQCQLIDVQDKIRRNVTSTLAFNRLCHLGHTAKKVHRHQLPLAHRFYQSAEQRAFSLFELRKSIRILGNRYGNQFLPLSTARGYSDNFSPRGCPEAECEFSGNITCAENPQRNLPTLAPVRCSCHPLCQSMAYSYHGGIPGKRTMGYR